MPCFDPPAPKSGPVLREPAPTEESVRPILPGLYIVATPIGNLGDISGRALLVLRRVDRVYAEDTRRTRILLDAHGIGRDIASYHDHNGAARRPEILSVLAAGGSVALVSDAGTPLIADPGLKLVREAIGAGATIFPVPGPCAAIAGLVASGLASDRFMFAGFPPAKPAARRRFLQPLAAVPATLVFFESPARLAASLADMASRFGAREAAVAREMTKWHESHLRAPLPELAARFAREGAPRGELVVLVGPPPRSAPSDPAEVAELLRLADPACRRSERAAIIARRTGRPRREIYARLQARPEGEGGA